MEMNHKKAVPDYGEGGGGAVGRGKCEQKKRMILTCVRKLAPIASQSSALLSVFGGSERLRKKEIIFFII